MKFLNSWLILHVLGIVLLFEACFMILALIVAVIYPPEGFMPMFLSLLITAASGALLFWVSKSKIQKSEPKLRDSFIIVSLGWILISLFGTLPYLFSESIPHFIDALFESVSGFTTTGSSILTDVEIVPKYVLFWRSETHWIGGMGIIVLVVAIFPFFNIGGNRLFSAEGTKISFEQIKPKVIDTAKRLWFIYIALTLTETLLLTVCGMELFDSICHSMGTIATGGFSTKNASIANYSPAIQYIVTLFMFLSAINFALHYFLFTGKVKRVWQNQEFRTYLFIVFSSITIITIVLVQYGSGIEKAFRDSAFQVISIISCTGFASADYLLWPTHAWILIFLLMFVGGCAGSTAGGIKVIRHLLVFKAARNYVARLVNPNRILIVKYNGEPIETSALTGILAFYFMYLTTFVLGSIVMVFAGMDFQSAMGAVITTLGGIGPGIGTVGPVANFSGVSDFGTGFLCFTMLLGRLEFYSLLVLMAPGFWKL